MQYISTNRVNSYISSAIVTGRMPEPHQSYMTVLCNSISVHRCDLNSTTQGEVLGIVLFMAVYPMLITVLGQKELENSHMSEGAAVFLDTTEKKEPGQDPEIEMLNEIYEGVDGSHDDATHREAHGQSDLEDIQAQFMVHNLLAYVMGEGSDHHDRGVVHMGLEVQELLEDGHGEQHWDEVQQVNSPWGASPRGWNAP